MQLTGLTRWPVWRRWFGTRAERAAERFLRGLGYRILARNVTYPTGELDLIALDAACIVFAEVRSTETADLSRPAASVDLAKQQKLADLAMMWLQQKKLLGHIARFDVLAVSWPVGTKQPTIEHFIDAFPPTGRFQMFR